MELDHITPLVLTFNEEPNISRTLSALHWAAQVVVLDSQSTDHTCAIAQQFPNVKVYSRPFETHAAQWNAGIELVATDWVLSLDADYVVSEQFVAEAQQFSPTNVDCIYAPLRFVLGGRPLSCSVLPPRPVLFKASACSYVDDGHTQRLLYSGPAAMLRAEIQHIDTKSLGRWYRNQQNYARLEARKLRQAQPSPSISVQLRRVPFVMVVLVPLYILFIRRGILEIWQGWAYAGLRALAELLISIALLRLLVSEMLNYRTTS